MLPLKWTCMIAFAFEQGLIEYSRRLMKKKLTALAVAATCAITASTAVSSAQPQTSNTETSVQNVGDLTGRELFEALYFGSGSGKEVVADALQDDTYNEFLQKVRDQRPVSETDKLVSSISDEVERVDPGHFELFKERITSGDPFEFRDQLGATISALKKLEDKAAEDQTSTPGQVKPDAAVPVWATALAVQWAALVYQYGAAVNAGAAVTVVFITKGWTEDPTKRSTDVNQLTADLAPKLAA